MNYIEYLNAAKRHRETCEFLIKKIKDKNEYIDPHLQKKLLQNIYYLSGYIIECIISYSFFKIICFDPQKSVYDLDKNNQHNYTFRKFFNEHSKNANQLRLQEIRLRGGNIPSSIPIIGEADVKQLTRKMYEEWDSKTRYTSKHLTFSIEHTEVYNFFNLANEIYIKLQRI